LKEDQKSAEKNHKWWRKRRVYPLQLLKGKGEGKFGGPKKILTTIAGRRASMDQ